MSGDLLDPLSVAGIAQAVATRSAEILRQVIASGAAAASSAAAAAQSLADLKALYARAGVVYQWTGPFRSILSLRLPDGSWGQGVDLKGVKGDVGATPVLTVRSVRTGTADVDIDSTDPLNPKVDFTVPQGPPGRQGDAGQDGAPGAPGAPGVSGSNFVGASTTAVTIGLGTVSVVLTAATAQAYAPTYYQALISAADPRNAMVGALTGYDPASGTLSLAIQQAAGSGTHADWIVTSTPPVYVPTGIDGGYAGDPFPPPGATPVYGATAPATGSGVDGGYA